MNDCGCADASCRGCGYVMEYRFIEKDPRFSHLRADVIAALSSDPTVGLQSDDGGLVVSISARDWAAVAEATAELAYVAAHHDEDEYGAGGDGWSLSINGRDKP